MTRKTSRKVLWVTSLFLLVLQFLGSEVQAKYSGGTGGPNDPYQIATAEDLMLLGENPEDYDEHFILTADIDLDPNLPGRKVFNEAVIGSGTSDGFGPFRGTPFTGVFDGNNHTISHLAITGQSCLGLFGRLGSGAEVSNLGLEVVDVYGTGDYVGGLVGRNSHGRIAGSFSTGTVKGTLSVGGLVGDNDQSSVSNSYSTGTVEGAIHIGGLVGINGNSASITASYSTSKTCGQEYVDGLVGSNDQSSVSNSYSTGPVSGETRVGGLVGQTFHSWISNCYSIGFLAGDAHVGGMVGSCGKGVINASYWDIQTSGLTNLCGSYGEGIPDCDDSFGLTTGEMQNVTTFLNAGWDFVDESKNGHEDVWKISDGLTYPLLSWQRYAGGTGRTDDPYQIATAENLMLLGESPEDYDKHFILTADIDLGGLIFDKAVIAPGTIVDEGGTFQGIYFAGSFDGNHHQIMNLAIEGQEALGLFGALGSAAAVADLGLEAVEIDGTDGYVGSLVACNYGSVSDCHSRGTVSGMSVVGGLVAVNHQSGSVATSYSTATVHGDRYVGGLVGWNKEGNITGSCSTGMVVGSDYVGGLVGTSFSNTSTSYSTATVHGDSYVGGLIGWIDGNITDSYSMGMVSGSGSHIGGLVGGGWGGNWSGGSITASFWDTQTSGQASGAGGIGRTTVEMQTAGTFLEAGWDFMGETANGTNDIWWILEGQDYPRLWWELTPKN